MRFFKARRRLIALAFVAAAATAVHISAVSQPSADVKSAFRRPPLKVGESAQNDPVWRVGKRLFSDPGLSGSGRTSCATCHQAALAWSNGIPTAVGDNGEHLPFKAPTLLNVGWLERMGWTGRFADTKAVTIFAMGSPATMNKPFDKVVGQLSRDQSYAAAFKLAFGHDGVTDDDVSNALVRYVNSITSSKTPFDSWLEGDDGAIDASAKAGFAIFNGKGKCADCHSGWTFTDGSYHDIGTAETDVGRGKFFPGSVKLQHAFKTPGLRGVVERAPYMHDGHLATLDDVIDLYDKGGIDRPSRAVSIAPLHLSTSEKADLKAFLKTLSGETEFIVHN